MWGAPARDVSGTLLQLCRVAGAARKSGARLQRVQVSSRKVQNLPFGTSSDHDWRPSPKSLRLTIHDHVTNYGPTP